MKKLICFILGHNEICGEHDYYFSYCKRCEVLMSGYEGPYETPFSLNIWNRIYYGFFWSVRNKIVYSDFLYKETIEDDIPF